MFKTTILAPVGKKLYFEIHAINPDKCYLEIKSGKFIDLYCIFLQKNKSFFIVRPTTGQCELTFSTEFPISAIIYSGLKKRPINVKFLEVIDGFRRKYASLWPDIKTEHGVNIREITPGRFMRSAYSKSEKLIFHRFNLATKARSVAYQDETSFGKIFSYHILRDLLVSLNNRDHQEFFLGADATKFNPKNHDLVHRFVTENFGDPASANGPAWNLMRSNPNIGMIYWSGEASKQAPLHHSRKIRRLTSILNIDASLLEHCPDLPPLFLIRSDALSWISALNVEPTDIDSGLYDAQSLQRILPALIQKAGYAIATLPDFQDVKKLGKSVQEAKWVDFRRPINVEGANVCFFVGLLDAQNCFSEHALTYMLALKRQGLLVYALGVSQNDPEQAQDPGPQYSDAFAARANDGYDFGLWAAALRRTPDVWRANSLLLTNDSIFPAPLGFDSLFTKLKNSPFDVTGLTEGVSGSRHIQSYFVHFSHAALKAPQVKRFWDTVLSWRDKDLIIALYEIAMTSKFTSGGLNCGVIFDANKYHDTSNFNPTLQNWTELIKIGFPFVKTQILKNVLRSNPETLDFLEAQGFSRDALTREFLK